MKTIIAGGRDITDYETVVKAIEQSQFDITEVVSGMALGVDTLAIAFANDNNIPVKQFPADWNKHGRAAGPIRNGQMAEYADALIAVWDGESKGTKNMITQAKQNHLKVYIYLTEK
jgi:hypothetical protein